MQVANCTAEGAWNTNNCNYFQSASGSVDSDFVRIESRLLHVRIPLLYRLGLGSQCIEHPGTFDTRLDLITRREYRQSFLERAAFLRQSTGNDSIENTELVSAAAS